MAAASKPASAESQFASQHRGIEVLLPGNQLRGRNATPIGYFILSFDRSLSTDKGKWLASGYASDGVRREYEILSRHLTPELKRELHALQAGDVVRAFNVHPAGDNFRFTLDEDPADTMKAPSR